MKSGIPISLAFALLVAATACVSHDKSRTRDGGQHDTASDQVASRPVAGPRAAPRPVGLRHSRVKALWVDAWGSGFETEERCDQLIQHCLKSDINTILLQVRRTGDAFYDSQLEPRGRIEGQQIDLSFDPLQYMVERARDEHGIRLEAWIVANRLWQSDAPPPASSPSHLLTTHPDWLMINRDGKTTSSDDKAASYLDPALPRVRAHLARVASDIARRYRVDAIHLDYIRYPDRDWGYGKESLERFRKDCRRSDFPSTSDDEFIEWRVKQVELTVQEIRGAVKSASPACELTAATILWGNPPSDQFTSSAAYRATFQNWPSWCRKGFLDVVYPMHYRRHDSQKERRAFEDWLRYLETLPCGAARKVIGLAAYMNDQQGTAAQVQLVDHSPRFSGYALFSYRSPSR